MCGRHRLMRRKRIIEERFATADWQDDWSPRYNIAPTQNVLAIRGNPKTGERTLDPLKWGLIPNWAKDEKIAYKTINARVETAYTAPSYRQAYRKRRCLIPVDGF